MPNWLPDWLPWIRPAGRLIWATVLTAVMLAPVVVACLGRPAALAERLGLRYRSADPVTWAGAMFAAVYVFALFLLGYAVIPHEWITFADGYLQWGRDKFVFKTGTPIPGLGSATWPFSVDAQAVRDIVVVGIYLVFFGLNLALWSLWQKRPAAPEPEGEAPEARPAPARTSVFGRPVRVRG
jgi:hypothetical protein